MNRTKPAPQKKRGERQRSFFIRGARVRAEEGKGMAKELYIGEKKGLPQDRTTS